MRRRLRSAASSTCETESSPPTRTTVSSDTPVRSAIIVGGIPGKESVQVLAHWKRNLLRTTDAVAQILDDLHASGMEEVLLGETKPVHEAITYLTNHQHRMRYAANRRRGLPIGSGPVEANAKSLYTIRMKRPGARWKPETADHVLQLRAHALSNRFEAAVEMIEPRRRVVRTPPSAAA